jgi:hypothetical protein
MQPRKVYTLKHATVEIYDQGPGNAQFVRTLFDDGEHCDGVPTFTEEDVARAVTLGYEGTADGVWKMHQEHDLLHSVVAEAAGGTYSAALRYEIKKPRVGIIPMEERVVFLVQKLVALLHRTGMSLDEIMEEIGYAPSRP